MERIKTALVFGRGVSGRGAALALEKIGVEVVCCDDEDYAQKCDREYDLVVVSPGVVKTHEVFDRYDEKVIGELELGAMLCKKPYIAVTGTNGKTTTVLLIGKMLEKSERVCVTGNVGRSFALDAVAADDYSVYVCEASSFQLETVRSFHPVIGAITNIDCDHIDRHGDFFTYAREKLKIARKQESCDYFILPYDDVPLSVLADFSHKASVVYTAVGRKVKGAWSDKRYIYWHDEPVCELRRIRMRGIHNLKNALIALAVAKLWGVSDADITSALSEFSPPEHRMKYVGSVKGVSFYNDSKGTNIGATKAAMSAMELPFCLIAGGSDKGCEYDELFDPVNEKLKKLCCVGASAEKIISAAHRKGFYNTVLCDKLSSAMVEAYHSGADCVLFSPASASFDSYTSYKERGAAFEGLFEEIKKSEKR